MGIILGLAAALLYGGSDFGGGLLSRQLGSLRVNVVGHAGHRGGGAKPDLPRSIPRAAQWPGLCGLIRPGLVWPGLA
jgi:hypothetical protein